LRTVNHTFPRFQVGGMGDGDTVPAMLPAGSFVLNRRVAGTMQAQGYQMGGSVSGGNSTKSQVVHVYVHAPIDLRGAIFRDKRDRQVVLAEIQDALKSLTDPSRLFKGW